MSAPKRLRTSPELVTCLPLSVPRTLWQRIYQFLDLFAHLTLLSTCKSLRIIGRDPCCWLPQTSLSILLGYRVHINGQAVGKKHLKDALSVMNVAKSLRIVPVANLELYMFRSNPTHVTLSQIMSRLDYSHIQKFQLRVLGLQNHVALSHLAQCNRLQNLSLSVNSPVLETALLPWITPSTPLNEIRSLKFKFDTNITGVAPEMDAELCALPKIKTLTLNNTNLAHARQPWPLFASVNTLTALDLRRCLLSAGSGQLIRQMPRLVKLSLADMKRLDAMAVFRSIGGDGRNGGNGGNVQNKVFQITYLSIIRVKLTKKDVLHVSSCTPKLSRLVLSSACLPLAQFETCFSTHWKDLTCLKLGPEAIYCNMLPLLAPLSRLEHLELYNLSLPPHRVGDESSFSGLLALASHLKHLKLRQVKNICEHDIKALSSLTCLQHLTWTESPLGALLDVSCLRELSQLSLLHLGADTFLDVHFVQLFLAAKPHYTFPRLVHAQFDDINRAMAFLILSQLPSTCACQMSLRSRQVVADPDPELDDAFQGLFGEENEDEEEGNEQTEEHQENVLIDRQLQECARHNGLKSLSITHVSF